MVGVEALADFDDFIDVRSPAEFAEDHLPGALSHPVLDDAERARVGTLYKQVSPFQARILGAGLVARNIAAMLESAFAAKPREWRPLVYCWRGGQRSGALAHVLTQVGWRAAQLEGGYKAYRRWVVDALATLPQRRSFVVICGLTGTGKSRLLQALAQAGEQVLDLEALAAHRGSLLGDLPQVPQPAQKMFDSRVLEVLRRCSPQRPIYVESESKRIGALRLPDALAARMWQSPCVRVELPLAQRVQLLEEEYVHFLAADGGLVALLDRLVPLHGKARVASWQALAQAGDWDALVADLLHDHYDPAYRKSMLGHYPSFESAPALQPEGTGEEAFRALAQELARLHGAGLFPLAATE
ncbi:MAG: tRNA 2-selenouridine(34) synthase MnmH [Burkholderiales bacterium]|nr:MAG: tRNA 2-selenouridine(34) synthase MnmH [Burkholderiales bacterium]